MTWQTILTLSTLALMVLGLIKFPHLADFIFMGAVTAFSLVGIITPAEAFSGFTNEGMLTIAALFIVAGALVETGVIAALSQRIFGNVETVGAATLRLVAPVIALSAFLNNTTVVAMAMPVVLEWSRKRRIPASKLLLPLSYAAILGGVCTLIGTSTNLVIHGMLKSANMPGLGMWELGKVGIPIALAGGLLLIFLGPRLLPERKEFLEQLGESRREFLVEMAVQPNCPLIGRTVQEAGLRQLPGLFLVEIERSGDTIAPVEPDQRLVAGDRLVFTGVVSTIVDLQKIPGLVPTGETHNPAELTDRRDLCEAVVSSSSPLIGRSIRDAEFRAIYDAAVIAVHRNGVRLRQKIGDIVLKAGDTLLLLTGTGFVRAHRNNPDFYLVSEAGDVGRIRNDKAWIAGTLGLLLIVVLTLPDVLEMFGFHPAWGRWVNDRRVIVTMVFAGLLVLTRCILPSVARRNIDWSVLIVIAAAFGVSKALQASGAAAFIAGGVVLVSRSMGPIGVMAAIYVTTWVLTEVMTNNAAAALMFPIAIATAGNIGADPRPFAITVAIAASSCFIFPAGYQTHLMVFGPGGYRISDFAKIGVPMAILWFALAIVLIPLGWPLRVH